MPLEAPGTNPSQIPECLQAVAPFVPVVEVSHHPHLLRVGRPDGKVDALLAVYLHRVRSELLIKTIMRSLVEKVQVVIGQQRHVVAHSTYLSALGFSGG
jgi:hypothetical protein